MKVGIICSHGGHLTEMRYLLNELKLKDYFIISYDSATTRALNGKKFLFPNFGSKPWKIIKYIPYFIKILLSEKPDILVSNGAEIAIPFFIIGKIFKIRTIFIECYTRVDQPTVSGKILFPFVNEFIIPWLELQEYYGNKAKYIGNLITITDIKFTDLGNKTGILVIVGMHDKNFDRLVKYLDLNATNIKYPIIIQKGASEYQPINCSYFDYCSYEDMQRYIEKSKLVVCQGGITIIDCLLQGTKVIAFPRKKEWGEAINDHQLIFSEKLMRLNLISVVTEAHDLFDRIDFDYNEEPIVVKINDEYIRNFKRLLDCEHVL